MDAVAAGEFVVVCEGVTKEILPDIVEEDITPIYYVPDGPHPVAQYEVMCGKYHTWKEKKLLLAEVYKVENW